MRRREDHAYLLKPNGVTPEEGPELLVAQNDTAIVRVLQPVLLDVNPQRLDGITARHFQRHVNGMPEECCQVW